MAAACGAGDFGDFAGLSDLRAALQEFFACAGGMFGPVKRAASRRPLDAARRSVGQAARRARVQGNGAAVSPARGVPGGPVRRGRRDRRVRRAA